ncbi:hypothetical protein N665_0066s0081 [Sinapis alba]|nr:hypothetical protein N665_0066s0081 [Sinapis alba]
MSRRLSREEKGKNLCVEPHEAPRTACVKASFPENAEPDSKFSLTLIGRITNPSAQRVWPLIAFFTELWKSDVRPVGADLGNGLFQFQFEREADLLKVLEKRPYHYSRWMVIVQRWEPTISKAFPALIPFWIRVQSIPIHLWNENTIQSIGEDIGVFEKTEITLVSVRMRVQVNGLLPLIKSSIIEYPNGGEVVATLTYERLEKHCTKCFRLDHELKDCLEAKHQNKARLADLEPSLAKEASLSTKAPALAEPNTLRAQERRQYKEGVYRFSASNTPATYEQRSHKEASENLHRRPYKPQSREWEARGSQRRSSQARERNYNLEDRHPRPPRDHMSYRNSTSQGRSFYREVARKPDTNKDAGSTASKTLDENVERGIPLQTCLNSIPHEVLQKALGEVRGAMMQYTKSVNPTESEERKKRMRQTEEQGEVEETALNIIRASLDVVIDKQRLEDKAVTPDRIPATQRLGSSASKQSLAQRSNGKNQLSNSLERVPASLRLGPVAPVYETNNPKERLQETEVRLSPSPDRIPAILRLGATTEPSNAKDQGDVPSKEKKRPWRPPGRKLAQNSPRLSAGASSRIRRVAQNKPSPTRRKQSLEKKTASKANSKADNSRRKGQIESSATSSENRPICNMIPATSRKRMDFRNPSTPGP